MTDKAPTPQGFRICSNRGFHVTFENGYTVSVQFGWGNYCSNHNAKPDYDNPKSKPWSSHDAETAVWGADGVMLERPNNPGDTVQGWQSPADVLALMVWAASQEGK